MQIACNIFNSERHFKNVKISALAMIKILNHAKRGDPI